MKKGLKIIGGSLLAAWVALNPGHALAQDNKDVPTSLLTETNAPSLGKKEMSPAEKAYAAQDYSVLNNGIGVFVNFAAVPELPPERLIRAIEGNFAKKGISINLQSNVSRGDLTTVTFFVEGTPFAGKNGNGYDLGELSGGFDTIVRAFEQQQAKKAAPGELHSAPIEQGR